MRTPDFVRYHTKPNQTSWHRFSFSMPGGQAKPIKEITIAFVCSFVTTTKQKSHYGREWQIIRTLAAQHGR